mmetsp:Transcript_2012/g.6678  ORF Transcript_2012/g.6678 Transcript_2012/m.6678 type:complete len:202 (-) Transcript_2012:372-977(-)
MRVLMGTSLEYWNCALSLRWGSTVGSKSRSSSTPSSSRVPGGFTRRMTSLCGFWSMRSLRGNSAKPLRRWVAGPSLIIPALPALPAAASSSSLPGPSSLPRSSMSSKWRTAPTALPMGAREKVWPKRSRSPKYSSTTYLGLRAGLDTWGGGPTVALASSRTWAMTRMVFGLIMGRSAVPTFFASSRVAVNNPNASFGSFRE